MTCAMGMSSTMGVMACSRAKASISRIRYGVPTKELVMESSCATRSVEEKKLVHRVCFTWRNII